MRPSLAKIVAGLPSDIDMPAIISLVNKSCGVTGIPTAETTYSWREIYAEMRAQGWIAAGGIFYAGDE